MTTSPLTKKLQIKPGHRILIVNPPAGYLDRLEPLPEGAVLLQGPETGVDVVHLFVQNRAELERLAPPAIEAIKYDGLFWISYPKRSSKVDTDLTRDTGWDIVEAAGLRGVAQIAVDEVWAATRFRPVEQVKRRVQE